MLEKYLSSSAHHGVCGEPCLGPQVRQGAGAPPQGGALPPGVPLHQRQEAQRPRPG